MKLYVRVFVWFLLLNLQLDKTPIEITIQS